jgi:hypothetical protein
MIGEKLGTFFFFLSPFTFVFTWTKFGVPPRPIDFKKERKI